jgi:hypothetical protein
MGDETTAAVGMGVGAARLMELFMDNVLVDAIISNRYYGSVSYQLGVNHNARGERKEQATTCLPQKPVGYQQNTNLHTTVVVLDTK